jgi:hypothetical protein
MTTKKAQRSTRDRMRVTGERYTAAARAAARIPGSTRQHAAGVLGSTYQDICEADPGEMLYILVSGCGGQVGSQLPVERVDPHRLAGELLVSLRPQTQPQRHRDRGDVAGAIIAVTCTSPGCPVPRPKPQSRSAAAASVARPCPHRRGSSTQPISISPAPSGPRPGQDTKPQRPTRPAPGSTTANMPYPRSRHCCSNRSSRWTAFGPS